MPTDDLLFTIAQVATAFAGFAGLVTALTQQGKRPAEQRVMDFASLQSVLIASLIVVAFSLLPAALRDLGFEEQSAWRLASVSFLLAACIIAFITLPGYLRKISGGFQRTPATLYVSFFLLTASVLVLTLIVLSLVPTRLYLVALASYLYMAGTAFFRVFMSLGRYQVQSD